MGYGPSYCEVLRSRVYFKIYRVLLEEGRFCPFEMCFYGRFCSLDTLCHEGGGSGRPVHICYYVMDRAIIYMSC